MVIILIPVTTLIRCIVHIPVTVVICHTEVVTILMVGIAVVFIIRIIGMVTMAETLVAQQIR